MALQNGLRPVDDEASAPTMNALNGRVEVRDPIQMPGLTPVAQPTNTFVRPAAPQEPTGAERLAQALMGLSPALQQFAQVEQAQQRDEMPGKVSRALTGRTATEQRQILATNPDMQNHLAQNMGAQMLGSAQAQETLDRLRTQYTTGDGFNREHDNFDQWANAAVQADLKANPDPHFADAYRQRMQPGLDGLRGAQLKYAADRTVQTQDQLIYDDIKARIGAGIDKGQTPEQVSAAIRNTFATTQTVANRPLEEQRQILVTALGRMAGDLGTDPQYAQKYQLIQGILSAQQPGPDGKPGASLLDSTTLGGQANDVLRAARRTFDQRDMGASSSVVADIHSKAMNADPSYKQDLQQLQKDHPDWTSAEHAVTMDQTFARAVRMKQEQQRKEALASDYQVQKDRLVSQQGIPLLQAGNVHALSDRTIIGKDGNPEVYSAKDQIADSVAAAQQSIEQKYAGQNTPEAQAAKFAEEAKLYSTNGVVNTAWKTNLNAGVMAASTITQAGGDPPPTLSKGFDLYKRLQASAPNLLAGLVDGKAAKFYQIAANAEQSLRLDEKQALSLATKATSDPTWDKADPGISKRDKDTKVQAALNEGWFQQHLPATVNSSDVIVETSRAADDLHKGLGLPYDEAIKAAAQSVSQNYQIINGTAVRTADKNVPSNFGQLASGYIDQWYDDHKETLSQLGAAKGDLTIRSLGSSPNWSVYIKGHPAPLQLPGAAFSLSSLYAQQQQLDAVEKDRVDMANDRAETKAARRYEPWVQLGNPENFFSLSLGPFRHDHTMDGHKGYLAEEEARWKAAKEKYRRESNPPAGPPQPTTMLDLGGVDSAIIRP